MHDYLLSSEWVRFAFVLGVAVSMVMYEKRHLTTGSIVVPGYIAVFIIHPLVILATFFNAFITYLIVNHFLRRYFLLYGRTKFTVLAVISTIFQTIMLRLTTSGRWLWEEDIPLFIGVGYIVPALIAHDMARQGMMKTVKSVLLAGALVATPIAFALIINVRGVNELSPVRGFGSLAFDPSWLPLAVALSVVGSWAVAHNYGLRSGGFVGAAFVGMFMADPWQVLAAIGIASATYIVVAKFLMKHMILFGRRKFSTMLLVSSSIAWSGLWVGDRFLNANWEQHLGVGSLALTPLLLPGLLANDAQRTSPKHVALGVVLAGPFVVSTTWWVQSLISGGQLNAAWKLVSIIGFGVLFHKQMRVAYTHVRERVTDNSPVEADPVTSEQVATPQRVVVAVQPAVDITRAPRRVRRRIEPVAEWSDQRRFAADDADARLLQNQIAQLLDSTQPTGSTKQGSTERIEPSTPSLDLAATAVLEDALVAERGMLPVPRRNVEHDQISETSDAPREAQLTASDVSDHIPPDLQLVGFS